MKMGNRLEVSGRKRTVSNSFISFFFIPFFSKNIESGFLLLMLGEKK